MDHLAQRIRASASVSWLTLSIAFLISSTTTAPAATPRISVPGATVDATSVQDFTLAGETTHHHFPISVAPDGSGTVTLVFQGTFEDFPPTVYAEGILLGSAAGLPTCSSISRNFMITAPNMATLVADGSVDVDVVNPIDPEPLCAVNRNTIELKYAQTLDRLDFGQVQVGTSQVLNFTIFNKGSDVLQVTSITADSPAYSAPAPFSLSPGTSKVVAVTFTPAQAGPAPGTLTISSNDPARPAIRIGLVSGGLLPPTIVLQPLGFKPSLDIGAVRSDTLRISNIGDYALTFSLSFQPGAGEPAFVTVAPATGTVSPGGSTLVQVTFDARSLDEGIHGGSILVGSNDPSAPAVSIPVALAAGGSPEMLVYERAISQESVHDWNSERTWVTRHAFPVSEPSIGGATLDVSAGGEFLSGIVNVEAEGSLLGTISPPDGCQVGSGSFVLTPGQFDALAADGVVTIDVVNWSGVDPYCPDTTHTVRLSYKVLVSTLDFGSVFVGASGTRSFFIENLGNSDLVVDSITSGDPDVVASPSSPTIHPGSAVQITVSFTPSSARTFGAALTVTSDDLLTPVLQIAISGASLDPPIIDVQPASIESSLVAGQSETRGLTITNRGSSPLQFKAKVAPSTGTIPASGDHATPWDLAGNADLDEANDARVIQRHATSLGPVSASLGGSFQALPPAPEQPACLIEDASDGSLYLHAPGGDLYRFKPSSGLGWQRLSGGYAYSGSRCGAAILNGKIYFSYSLFAGYLDIYDIAGDTWTYVDDPLHLVTANVASDGSRFLYRVAGDLLERFDPDAVDAELLASPPFQFSSTGGLRVLDGALYGHQGGGGTGFARYDIATDSWTVLASIPDGALTGAAIDPQNREYLTYGPFDGTNLYRYSIDFDTWNTETAPFAFLEDGGIAWLGGRDRGLYLLQGGHETAFTRLVPPDWDFAHTAPVVGTVLPGESLSLPVIFDSAGLNEGSYAANLLILSNDPLRPALAVPLILSVTGIPAIRVSGEPITIESTLDDDGKFQTFHHLPITTPPAGLGALQLTADGIAGDFDAGFTADAEGFDLGGDRNNLQDCAPVQVAIVLDAAQLSALSSDGVIDLYLRNYDDRWPPAAPPNCPSHTHTVRLSYTGAVDPLDFGLIPSSQSRTISILLESSGTSVLKISAITSDNPAFVPSLSTLSLVPGETRLLSVVFSPSTEGLTTGTLTIASDDPAAPQTAIRLVARVERTIPIDVQPPGVAASVRVGGRTTKIITLSNPDAVPLSCSLRVRPRHPEPFPYGVFTQWKLLKPSPVPVSCLVADPTTRVVYAQAESGTSWYRYEPDSDSWRQLSPSPVAANSGGSAAYLDGRIYVSYVGEWLPVGVYDITTDSWSTMANPLGMESGSIVSDGARYLYLLSAFRLARLRPADGSVTFLPSMASLISSSYFTGGSGGLAYLDGALYAHARRTFAKFDILTNLWSALPEFPDLGSLYQGFEGGGLGAAIDPVTRVYYAAGWFDTSWYYSYSIDQGVWTRSPVPYFRASEGGLAWLPGASPTLYMSSGVLGGGFAGFGPGPAFIEVAPTSATISPGDSVSLSLSFDTKGLNAGAFEADLEIVSSDLDDPPTPSTRRVPIDLSVVDAADIAVSAGPIVLESGQDLKDIVGSKTTHDLPVTIPPLRDGVLDIRGNGEFVSRDPILVTLEGRLIGTIEENKASCSPFSLGTLGIGAADLAAASADGIVEVAVQDFSGGSWPECPDVKNHTVRLAYEGSAEDLNFGRIFLGTTAGRSLPVLVKNLGTSPLVVSSIRSDRPEFVFSDAALLIDPGDSASTTITFRPTQEGIVSTSLHFLSNDPDTPDRTITLRGTGVRPPMATMNPTSIELALPAGGTTSRILRVGNDGGSDLTWSLSTGDAAGNPVSWLSPAPASGITAAGGSTNVRLDFTSAGLPDGEHRAILSLVSNDPIHAQTEVAILFHTGSVTLPYFLLEPATLNLSSQGTTVAATLQLPPPYDPQEIDVATLRLNGVVPANPAPVSFADTNGDGIAELVVKLDRAAVEAILPTGNQVAVTITGEVHDLTWFTATTTIRTLRPHVTHPDGGDYVVAGATVPVTWEAAPGGTAVYDVLLSRDGGGTWERLASGISGTSWTWIASGTPTISALVRILAVDGHGVMGYDTSDAVFTLAGAPAPPLGGRELRADADATNVFLAWDAPGTDLTHGPPDFYRILRATSPRGPFVEIATVTGLAFEEPAPNGPAPAAIFYKIVAANAAGDSAE